ncbi:MAG TPA: MFS transporter [Burkholderiales bacterium]|nr:MFS transporter [Burkholderiales bacterium]
MASNLAEVRAHDGPEQGAGPGEIWAWAMYDFANSGYTTVVITAVFNAYFVAVVAGNAPWATFAWTATLSLSYALVIVSAPVIGAYADLRANKKRLLLGSTVGCVLFTAALALAGPGDLLVAIVAVVLSNFFFSTGCDLVAAFLPELARGRDLGKVSGWGWSLGYIGGLITLGACLAYVSWAQAAGYQAAQFVPVTMLITAMMFAVASLPTFVMLRERATPQPLPPGASLVSSAFARLADTLRHAAHYQDLRRFLVCIVFYQAGVQTVISLAAIYAEQAMGFSTQETLILVLVVNVSAALGAFFLGNVQDRLGHVQTIALTLAGWIATVLIVWTADTRALFWTAANIAGLCLGASQSAGRALVGYMSPKPRRAEFFGLWGLATNLSSILGPITYGAVSWISLGNHRLAMLITGAFFVAGLLILHGVDARRGRRAALNN